MRASLLRVWTVTRAEGSRTGGSFNRKTLLAMVVLGLLTGALMPAVTERGLDFDRGIYRAAVTADSPLVPAIQQSRLFRFVDEPATPATVDAGRADIIVSGTTFYAQNTQKGNAAAAALKQAAKDYSFRSLRQESDLAAAFPVRVEVRYEAQEESGGPTPTGGTLPEPTPPTGEGQGGDVTGGGAAGGGGGAPVVPGGDTDAGFSILPPESSLSTPETLSPPFPFRSLLLAYLFLIPMNFVVQVYAGSAIAERLGRKGEALLASPARRWEIIAGKALPYFGLMMLIAAGITVWIGGGWLSLVAVAPLALAFLALEFVGAMFARSFRELTFLTVFTSVLITIYAFLPAVFTSVHPIALVSPISLVVFDLRGAEFCLSGALGCAADAVTLGQVLYATLPLTLFSLMLFYLGGSLYHEEDLFHQKRVLAKAVDAVARRVKGLKSAFKLSFLLIPLVFVIELLLITFLFAWPVSVGVVGILLAVALVEESFKGIPSYAALTRGRIPVAKAAAFGALVGLGFFAAEKGFLLASLVGLLDVPAASAVFGAGGAFGGVASAPIPLLALLLLGPLLLHVATAALTAWGAGQGRRAFAACFALSVMVHTLYNLAVTLWSTGGVLR